jgi:hypothetical protein
MNLESPLGKTHSKQIMVANAGIIVTKSLFEVSVDEWDKVMAVCTRSRDIGQCCSDFLQRSMFEASCSAIVKPVNQTPMSDPSIQLN